MANKTIPAIQIKDSNVGIGTTNPGAELHVQGTSTEQVIISYDSTRRMLLGRTTGYGWIQPYTNGVSYDNLVLVRDGGNVGIGTASPSAKLHVVGESKLTGSAAAYTFFDQINATYYSVWYRNNNITYLYDSYLNSTPFVINSSGNVGIGTNSPANKLVAVSDAVFNNDNTYAIAAASASDTAYKTVIGYSYANDIGLIAAVRSGIGWRNLSIPQGNLGIGTLSPAYKLEVNGDVGFSGGASLKWGSNTYIYGDNNIQIQAVVNGNTGWFINSSGNVGIGTTSPSEKLFVNSGGAYMDTTVSYGTNTKGIVLNQEDGTGYGTGIWFRQSGLTAGIGSTRVNSSDWATDLRFYTHPSSTTNQNTLFERMRINSEGNVGIGTTSPATALHISRTSSIAPVIRLQTTDSTTNGAIQWSNSANSVLALIGSNYNVGDGSGNLEFVTGGSSSTRMLITSSGNVGIGTTSPGWKLDVIGDVRASSYFVGGSSGQGFTWANFTYGSYIDVDNGQNALRIRNTSGTIMLEVNGYSNFFTGNLGVGTASPQGKLDVYTGGTSGWDRFIVTNTTLWGDGSTPYVTIGAGGVSGVMIFNPHVVWNSASSAAAIRLGRSGGVSGGAWYEIGTGSSDSFFIAKNGFSSEPRFYINSNGNVGIGTTSPFQKFQVVGNGMFGDNKSSGSGVLTVSLVGGVSDIRDIGYVFSGAANREVGSKISFIGSGNLSSYQGGYMTFSTSVAGETNLNERMRISSDGNVGIGTTSPAQKFEVYGDEGQPATSGSTQNGMVRFRTGSTEGWGETLDFGMHVGVSGPPSYAWLQATNAEDLSVKYNLILNPNGGNVGIGTTSPANKLVAVSDAVFNNDNTYAIAAASASDTAYKTVIGYSYANDIGLIAAVRAGIGWRNLSIPQGNLGIGTLSPTQKLEVNGNIKLSSTPGSTSTPSYIWLGNDYSDGFTRDKLKIYLYNSGTEQYGFSVGSISDVQYHSNIYHDFYTANSLSVRINGSGNVGIGTASPTGELHIYGSQPAFRIQSSVSGNMQFGQWDTVTNRIQSTGRNFYLVGTDSYDTIFATNGSERMRITSGGVVSIATTSPYTGLSTRLYVGYDQNSSVAVRDEFISVGAAGGSTNIAGINFLIYNAGYGGRIYTDDNLVSYRGLVFDVLQNGTFYNAMSITRESSPKIGIGTTSPKTKLDVNGQIGFGSKSMIMTDTFAAALTVNMNDHTGCYVKITAFGDWSNHSSIAYLGEFFLQASSGGYNEPGVIIRQVDNTAVDDIQAQILDPIGAGTRDFIIELRASSPNQTPFTAHIQYEIRGQYNSVN